MIPTPSQEKGRQKRSLNTLKMKTYIIFLTIVSFLSACNKSGNEPLPNGPVTKEEIATLPLMTLSQIEKAYRHVIQENPTLLQDSIGFARAVFNRLKTNPNGRIGAIFKPQCEPSVFNKVSPLSLEELTLIFNHISSFLKLLDAVNSAEQNAVNEFPCDVDVGFADGKADAVRHAFWNALMVKHISLEFAEEFGMAHEHGCLEPASLMDLHNNRVGRVIALKYPSANDQQLLELIIQQKFEYITKGSNISPESLNSLVYFSAKRRYDGTLTGYLTNPDGGTTWDVSFDLNQCDDIIRGQFTTTGPAGTGKRRFFGIIQNNGSITLEVAYPYVFEINGNYVPCTNMRVELKGNENQLFGNWTSNNCKMGGEIKVAR